jgi:hypothetical protein
MFREFTLPPIFVVGSGRSGTTWVGDVLGTGSGCVPIFEPLSQRLVPQCPRWKQPGPYLRKGTSYPQWEAYFDGVLSGRISNRWTRQDYRRMPKLLARRPLTGRIGVRLAEMQYRWQKMRGRRYLVKEVHGNLALAWLQSYTSARLVYLVRHPCAVVGSRLRLPEHTWLFDMDEILGEPELMKDHLEPFRTTISGATTALERLTVSWCIENLVPLTQSKSHDWLCCFYEDFLSDREEVFARLFRWLGLLPTSVTKEALGLVVSSPTHDPHTTRPWHAPLSEAEGECVLRICDAFGLRLYGRQTMPLVASGDLAGFVDTRSTSPSSNECAVSL